MRVKVAARCYSSANPDVGRQPPCPSATDPCAPDNRNRDNRNRDNRKMDRQHERRRPRGRATRVTSCVMRGQNHFAEAHRVALEQHTIDRHRRLAHDLPVFAVVEVALAAVLDHRDVVLHHSDLRAGELLLAAAPQMP